MPDDHGRPGNAAICKWRSALSAEMEPFGEDRHGLEVSWYSATGTLVTPQSLSLDTIMDSAVPRIELLCILRRRIHEPVPIFNGEILKPVSNFMSRIAPNKPFYRANWTVRICCRVNNEIVCPRGSSIYSYLDLPCAYPSF